MINPYPEWLEIILELKGEFERLHGNELDKGIVNFQNLNLTSSMNLP